MPLRNRVTPLSGIEATPARGLFTGNRGVLHDDRRRLVTDRWRTKAWIVCSLAWKGVRRVPMTPRRWTELFFLDEAVALAAGHRPCAYCRRPAFREFLAAAGFERAPHLDAALHADRVPPLDGEPRPTAPLGEVAAGSFVLWDDWPHLVTAAGLLRWTHFGYDPGPRPAAGERVAVVTPGASVAALRGGYRPVLHPSAGG
jgi:hypothetical protein